MTDRAFEICTIGDEPWEGDDLTPHVRIGNLNGLLGLTSDEWGLAAGADLDDTGQAYLLVSKGYIKLNLAGATDGIILDENGDTTIYASDDDRVVIKVGGVVAMTIDLESVAIYDQAGVAKRWLTRSGGSYHISPDLYCNDRGGIAADHSIGFFIDANNEVEDLGTNPYLSIFRGGKTFLDAIEMIRFTIDGNQWFMDDSVAHGATDVIDLSSVYGEMGLNESGAGGLQITGLKDSSVASGEEGAALVLRAGLAANVEVGSNTTARSIMEFYAGQLSGTDWANVRVDGNCFGFFARVSGSWQNCLIIDEDGDLKYRGALETFDEEDDVQALDDLYHLMAGQQDRIVKYDHSRLATMKIVTPGDDVYLRRKGLQALMLGAFRQIGARQKKLLASMNDQFEQVRMLAERVAVLEAS